MTNVFQIASRFFAGPGVFCAGMMMAAGALLAATNARAQALPAAEASPISTGFTLPEIGGSLRWGVSAAESLDWGYYNQSGLAAGTNVSGDVAYLSSSVYRPFSLVLSGGRSWENSKEPSYSFASLAMSQVFLVGRWNIILSDAVSYLPETATTGLSGVAGVGDLGVPPVQTGLETGQGLLTNYSPEVTNTAAASASRQITGRTSLNASGSYTLLRFLDGPGGSGDYGLESDSVTGSAGFTHRLDPRTTYGANYAYSSYIYLDNLTYGIPAPNFVSQTASFTFSRQLNRKTSLSVAAGPQWTQLDALNNTVSLNAFADASVNYSQEFSRFSLSYVRSTNSGYGVVGGALSDSVTLLGSRTFERVWNLSASIGWSHFVSLPTPDVAQYNFETVVAGFQASRALARNLSAFASYTLEDQTHSSAAGTLDLYNGVNQVASFGVTYSPASSRFGHR